MGIGRRPDEQLGSSVPSGADVLSQWDLFLNILSSELACKAEIAYLKNPIP